MLFRSGVPANAWIPCILPSKYDAGSAFVVFDNHRRGDFTPYVYRTDDWGKTWKSLAPKDLHGYALAVEQDPVDRNLLFLGTEFTLYVSFDSGAHWTPWKNGLPTTSMMALKIHPRDHDLVIGTHGRAVWVLDDVTPLREVSASTLAEPIHLYSSRPGMLYRAVRGFGGIRGGGAGEFQGKNAPYGAAITFSLNDPKLPLPDDEKERQRKEAEREKARTATTPVGQAGGGRTAGAPREDVPSGADVAAAEEAASEGGRGRGGERGGPKAEIRITDASGKLVRTLKPEVKQGINRVMWDFGREPFRNPESEGRGGGGFFGGGGSGPNVVPGTYNVVVKYGKQEAKGTVKVEPDPSLKATEADWKAWDEATVRVGQLQNAVADAVNRLNATRKDVSQALAKLDARDKEREQRGEERGKDEGEKALRQAARDLQKKITAVERRFQVPSDTKGLVEDDTTASSRVGDARRALGTSWETPSPMAKAYTEEAETAVRGALADFNKLYAEDVPAFQKKLADAKVGLLMDQGPIEVK